MGITNLRRTLVSAAVAVAFGLSGSPAGAVVYQGAFDPDDFSGTFTISVDSDCLTSVGFHHNLGTGNLVDGDGFCNVSLTSAQALVSNTTPLYNGTLNFAPPAIFNNNQLFGVNVVFGVNGYTLDSLDTALLHYVPPGNPPTTQEWWLQFRSGQVALCFPNCYNNVGEINPLAAGQYPDKGVYLFGALAGQQPPSTPTQSAIYTRITAVPGQIPEPGTAALLLGGLGSAWLARRRKKSAD